MKNNGTNKLCSGAKAYTAPDTRLVSVATECGICAGSKDKVVINDDNTSTDIERQTGGDDFTIESWD